MKKLEKLFKKYELRLLESFRDKLPVSERVFFEQQLKSVGVVQREPKGFSVNMYSKRIFAAKQLDCEPFPDFPDELQVAECRPLDLDDRAKGLVGRLWFVQGRPFSIEFEGVDEIVSVNDWQCELTHEFGSTGEPA